MTTLELTASARTRLADRGWWLTCAAGLLLLAGLALALAGGSLALLAALVAGAGALIGLVLLMPRAIALARSNRGLIVFFAVVLVGSAWFTFRLVHDVGVESGMRFSGVFAPPDTGLASGSPFQLSGWRLLPIVAILLATAAGLVLSADAVRVWLGYAPHQRGPWKEMTETEERSDGIAWRALLGVLLVGGAALLAIELLRPSSSGGQASVLLAVAVVTAVVIGMPVAIGSLMRVDRDKAGSARERERQRFAAHLHDSVLQTLALVQRQAHDPAAVARLARRQEHALRAWMAGETELLSETLVAGLRDAVASVEDDHGVTVELTSIGDRPLDAAGEELVAAAREALRNAARYAGGARVFVFAEVSATGAEVFVRDEGPGFEPRAVPAERRGIRDAIVGRMASAGGSATVESAPGEGTEVSLRICSRKAGR